MNECKIVQDLMPLYIDDLLSDESKETVRAHVAACEKCRKMLDRSREPMPEADQDSEGYKKTMRANSVNMFTKLLLVCILIAAVLAAGCIRLTDYLASQDGSAPVEQIFESSTGLDVVTVVDWDESGYFMEGSGSILWHKHSIFMQDEHGSGTTGFNGSICVPWEDIRLEWAPNGIDFIVTARLLDGSSGIFIFDTEDWLDEDGRHHGSEERYPRDYDSSGLREILIPLCKAHPDFPTGWENVELTFFRWSDDSERITFVYELDNGTRGFLEYEYKTETIISID